MKRLKFLLEKSGAYATILSSKLAKQQEEARERGAQLDAAVTPDAVESAKTPTRKLPARSGRPKRAAATAANASMKKRKLTDANYQLTDYIGEEVPQKEKKKKTTQVISYSTLPIRMSKNESSRTAVSVKPLFRNNPKRKRSWKTAPSQSHRSLLASLL